MSSPAVHCLHIWHRTSLDKPKPWQVFKLVDDPNIHPHCIMLYMLSFLKSAGLLGFKLFNSEQKTKCMYVYMESWATPWQLHMTWHRKKYLEKELKIEDLQALKYVDRRQQAEQNFEHPGLIYIKVNTSKFHIRYVWALNNLG